MSHSWQQMYSSSVGSSTTSLLLSSPTSQQHQQDRYQQMRFLPSKHLSLLVPRLYIVVHTVQVWFIRKNKIIILFNFESGHCNLLLLLKLRYQMC